MMGKGFCGLSDSSYKEEMRDTPKHPLVKQRTNPLAPVIQRCPV